MKNYDLYLITNEVDNKKYVGITKIGYEKRFEKRLLNAKRFYRRHHNILLYLAIRKHGAENFSIKFLREGDSWKHLQELEIAAIIEYNTFMEDGCGYNMTRGGEGTDGYKFTQEQLDRRPKTLSKEHKANIKANNGKYWLGKNHTEETIDKIKLARANQVIGEATRQKHRDRWLGHKNPNAKAVLIKDLYFETVKEAAEYADIHPESLSRRVRNPNFPDYIWADIKT